ncbi:MAG: ABC transporter permease [Clostridia bacterium]|nr:ABC transporter permease [Clostridia bacterium]
MEISTILWREWVFFKKRWLKIVSSQIVTPILYLITFGWGIGSKFNLDGMPYLFYIIPGIIGMNTMRVSYSYISTRVSVARLHERSFEAYLLSPIRIPMLIMGHVLAGALRSMISVLLILLILAPFGGVLNLSLTFFVMCFLNSMMFACLGFLAAMIIDTHYDLNRFQSFVITPMSFLCGTFFSLTKLPWVIAQLIEILPLTHSICVLRKLYIYGKFDGFSMIVMLTYTVFFFVVSVKICYEESRI